MKKITILVLFILGFINSVFSQTVFQYGFSQTNETYSEITGGTILGTETADDQFYIDSAVPQGGFTRTGVGFPIGFNFTFNGVVYDRFGVNNNGWISLGTSTTTPSVDMNSTSSYAALESLNTTVANNLVSRIAGLGRDIQNQVGGELSYQLSGVSPNQVVTIQWKKFKKYYTNGDGDIYNFQIKLLENGNLVKAIYGNFINNANSTTVQVGLRANPNTPATNFSNRTTTTSWNATTNGAQATNSVALSASIIPTSGLTFTWTPPIPCSGTPSAGTITPSTYSLCSGAAVPTLFSNGYSTGVTNITFQWEESTNGTTWNNAVGGSSDTPNNYSPPAFSGTPIQYRLKATCANSSLSAYSNVVFINNAGNPTLQVTNATVLGISDTSATINWINGNGNRRLVILSDSPTITNPVNGTTAALVANSVYSGSGQQIIYDNTNTSVTVTGLIAKTNYYIKVYESLRCGTDPYDYFYNTSTGTNIISIQIPDYVNLQFPSTANTVAYTSTVTVYGQIYEGGLTDVAPNIIGQAPGIEAWVGISPIGANTNPNSWTTFIPATFNSGNTTNNDEYQAAIGNTLPEGTYYYAYRYRLNGGTFVYGGIDSTGNGNFWNGTNYNSGVLTIATAPPPSNDECSTSILLVAGGIYSDNAINGTNVGATTSSQTAPTTCYGFLGGDVWYSVIVPANGNLTVETGNPSTASTGIDTVVTIYSGTDCNSLTQIDCDDDGGAGAYSLKMLTGLTPGTTLYLRVYEYNNDVIGNFSISAYDASLGNASFDTSNFSFYPNPVKDILNLSYSQNISKVQVINLLGQEVIAKSLNDSQTKIDISSLVKGTYLVRVTSNNLVKTIKIIKE